MNNKKMKISQDSLCKYLDEHNIKMSRIAELMGKSPQFVTSNFHHDMNRHGNPRTFSKENIQSLNEALPKFAQELRSLVLTFGTDQTYTNKHGRTYDPGQIEPLKRVGKLLPLTKFTQRVLGWNKGKKISIITDKMSKAYGNISEDDVEKVNADILAIAGVLSNIEVVPDDNAYDESSSSSSAD